jgi:hypothetical protein
LLFPWYQLDQDSRLFLFLAWYFSLHEKTARSLSEVKAVETGAGFELNANMTFGKKIIPVYPAIKKNWSYFAIQ